MTMKRTLGAPSLARSGDGHAGSDSPIVRPMRPGNVVPGLYSLIAISASRLLVSVVSHGCGGRTIRLRTSQCASSGHFATGSELTRSRRRADAPLLARHRDLEPLLRSDQVIVVVLSEV